MLDLITNPKKRIFIELIFPFTLSVIYFVFVRDYAIGVKGDCTNVYIFDSCSYSVFHPDQILDVWKGRLAGLLMSGGVFDFLINNTSGSSDNYSLAFGLYQALWSFLLFVTITISFRNSLVINLGVFLGLMYNLIPESGLYFYPWDIPSTLFFTLAVIFFSQRRTAFMLTAICIGCLYKETVLVCALLAFFLNCERWKRFAVFIGIFAFYIVAKRCTQAGLHISSAAFSMNNSQNYAELLKLNILRENIGYLFSDNFAYIAFANCGSLLAVIIFGWQKRFRPFMLLICLFIAGQAMYGSFKEFRIFMQVLPLSVIILSERWNDFRRSKTASNRPDSRPGWHSLITDLSWIRLASLQAIGLLVAIATVLIMGFQIGQIQRKSDLFPMGLAYSTSKAGIQNYQTIVDWYEHGLADSTSKLVAANEMLQDGQEFQDTANWFKRGYITREWMMGKILQQAGQDDKAVGHFLVSMGLRLNGETNSAPVENSVAWCLATGTGDVKCYGIAAVVLAKSACEQTQFEEPATLVTLAAACAENGEFSNSVVECQAALDLASGKGQTNVADKARDMLALFKKNQPYRVAKVENEHDRIQ